MNKINVCCVFIIFKCKKCGKEYKGDFDDIGTIKCPRCKHVNGSPEKKDKS